MNATTTATCSWCGALLDDSPPREGTCSPECSAADARCSLLPHELDRAEFLAGQRNPEPLIAHELRLTPHAWGRLRATDRGLRDALARGRAREHKALVDALYAEAVDGGNVPAALFLLRCRHGYDDKSADTGARVNVTVSLPPPLDAAQWHKLRAIVGGKATPATIDVTPRAELPAEGAA
ncbi:MAG: hypothetical protein AMXMBFR36_27870 [Acidobacteriota bacterium]